MLEQVFSKIDGFLCLKLDPTDRVSLIRARLLLFCPTLFGIFGFILSYLYAQSPDSSVVMVVVAALVSAVMFFTPAILYVTKSTKLAGWMTVGGCCAALFPEPLLDLGFREPELAIIVMLPVLAGLLISRQGASITYLLCSSVLVLVLIRLLNWPPETLAAIPASEHLRFFSFAFASCTSSYLILLCFMGLFQTSFRDVQKAVAEAQAASEAKSAFLANISHELRTPINGILGFSKLALKSDLGADERTWISTIETSGQNLLSIVNDVLDMSKLEAGVLSIENTPFELGDVLDQVLAINSRAAAEKNLHLGAVADANMPQSVSGDPGRLRQVLTNLVANAVKFTQTGGVVINVSAVQNSEESCLFTFEVVDTGIGIPEEKIPTLFDRFTQVDDSRARKFGGTGLGLAICKDLVDLMGGSLGVRSVQNRGSAFWFSICLATNARLSTDQDVPAAILNDTHVLVAGNPSLHRSIIERQLQQQAISYRYCDYGPDFLDKLKDPSLSVIFALDPPPSSLSTLAHQETRAKRITISSAPKTGSSQLEEHTHIRSLTAPIGHRFVLAALERAFAPHATEQSTASSMDVAPSNSGRILLAEDNLGNQLLFQTLLKEAGYTVDVVENGHEAVQAVREKRYDLILMDGQMPEMDGVEATKEIRNTGGPQAHIPIIAITANTMTGDREQYLKAGMNDYLPKPIDFDEFYAKVSQWVEQVRHNPDAGKTA